MIYIVSGRGLAQRLEHLFEIFPELKPRIDLRIVPIEGKTIYELDADYVRKIVEKLDERPTLIIVPFTVSDKVFKVDNVLIVPLKNLADTIPLAYFVQENDPESISGLTMRELEKTLQEYKQHCERLVYSLRGRLSRVRGFVGATCRRALTGLPPLILSEIIDATVRDVDSVRKIAESYVNEGTDGIDIGCRSGHPRPDRVREIAQALRREYPDVLLSIDTFSLQEIEAALPYVDIILSLTPSQLQECRLDLSDKGVVVIPDVSDDDLVLERFSSAIEQAQRLRCVPLLDPLLRPPLFGLARSLCLYHRVRQSFPDTPTFMGVGNVTELIDADSTGLNALLAALAVELETDMVLTTEASVKTSGCVRELRTALYMATVAKILGKYPKDMSVSLLLAKSKY